MFKSINGGRLPERATKYSAGFDVFANENIMIGAGETKLVSLGIAIDLDRSADLDYFKCIGLLESYYLHLHPRSSIRLKGIGGGIGVIDIDYKDEIKMVMTAPSSNQYLVTRGDKIGQMVLMKHEGFIMPVGYTKMQERIGSFGSTGL